MRAQPPLLRHKNTIQRIPHLHIEETRRQLEIDPRQEG